MIFSAVFEPMPGSASSSFSLAVLMSTFVPEAGALEAAAVFLSAFFVSAAAFDVFSGFLASAPLDSLAAVREDEPDPAVTCERSLSIVFAERPAFESSSTEPYGRFATIFAAVALPTPGSASSSFSEALLRSTLPADFDAAARPTVRLNKKRLAAASRETNLRILIFPFLPEGMGPSAAHPSERGEYDRADRQIRANATKETRLSARGGRRGGEPAQFTAGTPFRS